MAVARQTPELLSATIARVRAFTGDRSSNTAIQRSSDADALGAINDAMVLLQTKRSGVQMGEALVPVTVTYTSGASSVNLGAYGADITLESIGYVEDITNASIPLPLEWITPSQIESFRSFQGLTPRTRRVYTLVASAATHQIRVRPIPPADTTLQIWYLAPAFAAAASSDTFPLAARWQRTTALMAACDLLAPEDECPQQLIALRDEAIEEFMKFGQMQKRGLRMLPSRRLGRS